MGISISRDLPVMSDAIGVRNMWRDIKDYRAALPKTAKGAQRFDYSAALGFQRLQYDYQRATTLAMVDCEAGVISFHARPGHHLKAAPMATIRCGGDVAV